MPVLLLVGLGGVFVIFLWFQYIIVYFILKLFVVVLEDVFLLLFSPLLLNGIFTSFVLKALPLVVFCVFNLRKGASQILHCFLEIAL